MPEHPEPTVAPGLFPPPVLIAQERLQARVTELAAQISRDYAGLEIAAVCTLGGSYMFFADLMRQITVPAAHLFLGFTGYGRGTASGEARITLDVAEPLEGRHVLLLEGAVVSGRTPRFILDMLRLRRPASLKFCTLLVKRKTLQVDLPLDYVAFDVLEDRHAIGYGMGRTGRERGLSYIGYVQP